MAERENPKVGDEFVIRGNYGSTWHRAKVARVTPAGRIALVGGHFGAKALWAPRFGVYRPVGGACGYSVTQAEPMTPEFDAELRRQEARAFAVNACVKITHHFRGTKGPAPSPEVMAALNVILAAIEPAKEG